jgi:hypothetical protein
MASTTRQETRLAEGFYMTCYVYEKRCTIPVDSGATGNFVQQGSFMELRYLSVSKGGGVVRFPVDVDGQEFWTKFVVEDQLTCKMVLGMDFLLEHKAMLDLQQLCCKLGEVKVDIHLHPEEPMNCRASAIRGKRVPVWSESCAPMQRKQRDKRNGVDTGKVDGRREMERLLNVT